MEEDLPFAIEVVNNNTETPQHSTACMKTGATCAPPDTPDTSSETVASSCCLSSSHQSQSQSHPNASSLTSNDSSGDASSILNTSREEIAAQDDTLIPIPRDCHQNSTAMGVSSSFLNADSYDLEAAASLLLPTVGAKSSSSGLLSTNVLWTSSSATTPTIPENYTATAAAPMSMATSQDFSQLLEAAADDHDDGANPHIQRQALQRPQQQQHQQQSQPSTFMIHKISHSMETVPTGRLESLPEESDEQRPATVVDDTERSETSDDCIILEAVNHNNNSNNNTDEPYSASSSLRQNRIWAPNNMVVPLTTATHHAGSLASSSSRLASLAGATAFVTGDDQFQVSIHITSSQKHPINIPSVVDLLSNPHLLHLWCDPIVSEVIIVKTSNDGSTTNEFRRQHQNRDPNRVQEGEWMEATTHRPLLLPPGYGRNCTQSLRNALGWNTDLATVVIFVERLLSRVHISISKFPGNVEITHVFEISVLPNDIGKLRIQNSVRVKTMYDDEDISSCCCGIFDMVGQCFFQPTIQEYMDQTLGSMARLRFLIEHGESTFLPIPEVWIAADHRHGDEMCSPLLVHA